MKESDLNNLAKELEGFKKAFDALSEILPKVVEKSTEGLSEEELEKIGDLSKKASEISNNENLTFAEKLAKLQILKTEHGTSNHSK